MYTNEFWQEKENSLRNYDEKQIIDELSRGLALRPKIEQIVRTVYDSGFDAIYFIGIGGTWASCLMAESYMKSRSALPVYAENAAEFCAAGNRRVTSRSVIVFSSVSGTTGEMIAMAEKARACGCRLLGFVDTPDTPLAELADWTVTSPKNEQIKFYTVCNYLLFLNHEFDDYETFCAEMDTWLAKDIANVEKEADAWAMEYARRKAALIEARPDMPHYYLASGPLYGAAYSCAMCYHAEQLWIKTVCVSCHEFFHGMQEVITKDVPVTVWIGEDETRPLAERAAKFLPKVCADYTILDSSEFPMEGIDPKYRGIISFLIIRAVNNRIDTYLEHELRHPMSIRRYYRQFEY